VNRGNWPHLSPAAAGTWFYSDIPNQYHKFRLMARSGSFFIAPPLVERVRRTPFGAKKAPRRGNWRGAAARLGWGQDKRAEPQNRVSARLFPARSKYLPQSRIARLTPLTRSRRGIKTSCAKFSTSTSERPIQLHFYAISHLLERATAAYST
jgi:hypothetical protein